MFELKKLTIALAAAVAMPIAMAQTTASQATPPTGEESKISQPAKTSTKGEAKTTKAKAQKVSPEQAKIQERTANETRDVGTFKKKTEAEKQAAAADKKAKRTGVTPEEQAKQAKQSPGG